MRLHAGTARAAPPPPPEWVEWEKCIFDHVAGMQGEVVVAHCVSEDAAISAGIAPRICRRLCDRQAAIRDIARASTRVAITQGSDDNVRVAHLRTKKAKTDLPSLASVREALNEFFSLLATGSGRPTVVIPRIASKLDGLLWDDVRVQVIGRRATRPLAGSR